MISQILVHKAISVQKELFKAFEYLSAKNTFNLIVQAKYSGNVYMHSYLPTYG